jgi:murein DD-endopeptidase MepM/ murein hydrolase activator NlpD
MSQLTNRDKFDVFGVAFREIAGALASLGYARSALVGLVDDATAEEQEGGLKAMQKSLNASMQVLYRAACEGGRIVLIRPLPVPGRRIIKRFNDPIRPNGPGSEGIVFNAELGDPVCAPCDGTVLEAGIMGGVGAGGFWGKRIAIEALDGKTVVWLCHLDAVDMAVGDVVSTGDIVGRAGKSGNATLTQVLMVVQDDVKGLSIPGVPFKVADPWPLLFDKDNSDAYYLVVGTVEG